MLPNDISSTPSVLLERYKFCGHSEREKTNVAKESRRQIKCWRTGYESTPKKKCHPRNKSYEKKILNEEKTKEFRDGVGY